MKALEFVEIDIDYCSLSYGVAPCAAPLGEAKCFNTKATCKSRPSFEQESVTLRFAVGAAYLPESGIDYVASCIESISYSPGEVSLGENLGKRSSLTVEFSDFPHPDTGAGFDKYYAERDYNPFEVGTFWGKFRARNPFIRGRKIRWVKGYLGQTREQMEVRHFLMDSFNGPSLNGRFSITAKDALKLADDDRVKAPVASRGFLQADILPETTVVTIGPAGIGDLEYPESGWVNIAGKEICMFTRVGDTFTLVRAQEGTLPVEHKAQDRMQVCLRYNGADPADIIRDLLVTYAKIDPDYIRIENWKDETGLFLRRLYSRVIAEPTGVSKLISELIEQAGLMVWWDDTVPRIVLRVMREIPTDAEIFNSENILVDSLSVSEQPNSRVSQVMTYFGKRTPLESEGSATSYHSVQFDVNLESEDDYGDSIIKTIHSSWIPQFGRPIARRLNDIVLGRFVNPPRLFTFTTPDTESVIKPSLGGGYRLLSRNLQDSAGFNDNIPIQITKILPRDGSYQVTAREMHFTDFSDDDLDSRVIIIDSNALNFHWRNAYDQLYPPPKPEDEIICIIASGAIVGSQIFGRPSFDVGMWPEGINLELRIQGRIQGKGGDGGSNVERNPLPGQAGGTALFARYPVTVTTSNEIWGGGGGGGAGGGDTSSSGGGGGQGFIGGYGGSSTSGKQGNPGGIEFFGQQSGRRDGRGGAAGMPGANGRHKESSRIVPGGAAGIAIDGNSYITFTGGEGDVKGPRVN